MIDVVKDYLVSLGFDVDSKSFNNAKTSIAELGAVVNNFVSKSSKGFLLLNASVLSVFAAITIGTGKLLESLAKIDLRNEMFARRMWISKENAVALNNTLKVMGATLDDLYLSPELANRFVELRKEAMKMSPGLQYDNAMKSLRLIMFEFQRFKLEATYALQWIGLYLTKYLEKPLGGIKLSLEDLNDRLQKSMPEWTKKIAEVVSWFVRLGIAGGKAFKDIIQIIEKLPTSLKIVGGAIAGFFGLMKLGSLGWITAGLTTLLLLLEDFYIYKAGGRSAFSDLWKWIEKLSQSKEIKDIAKSFVDISNKLIEVGKSVWELIVAISTLLNDLSKKAGFENFGQMLEKSVLWSLNKINEALILLINNLKALGALLKGDLKTFFGIESKNIKGLAEFFGWSEKNLPESVKPKKDEETPYKSGEFLDKLINKLIGKSSANIQTPSKNIFEEMQKFMIPIPKNPSRLNNNSKGQSYESNNGLAYTPASSIANYMTHSNNKATTINTTQNIEPTINVYGGSDSTLTAKAVLSNMNGIITRNFRSVVV